VRRTPIDGAWKYGTTYTASGATANMKLGGRDYLVQSNWVNTADAALRADGRSARRLSPRGL